MTEEEKDVVERLTHGEKIDLISLIRKFKREGIENFVVSKPEYIKILLNLIEKQSKEIECLKRQSKELIEKYDEELLEKNNYIFSLETEREALHKIIDESFE